MNQQMRKFAVKAGQYTLSEEEWKRIEKIRVFDEGHGYDMFGLEKESLILSLIAGKYIYEKYFRVESFGVENIPSEGRGMLVCNHSGILPIDAAMIAMDIFRKTDPPRLVRAVVDRFFMRFPFVGLALRRLGQINGMKRDFEELLKRDELTLVFPEGTRGNGKHFSQRYRLQMFNVGFMEIALQTRSPVIPTCVIGSEEQAPMVFNIKPLARALGFPFFPVTPTFPHLGPLGMLPLPVKYRIYYGEPIHYYRDHPPEAVNDPGKIRNLVEDVKGRIQRMIDKALEERPGIFV